MCRKIIELLQCNECGAREWSVVDYGSEINHLNDGCMQCDDGVYLFRAVSEFVIPVKDNACVQDEYCNGCGKLKVLCTHSTTGCM